MLDREARERDRIAERQKGIRKELEREREHPLNKAYEMRRAERGSSMREKRVNDIAAQYDRILEVDEKRQVAKDMMLIHASEKKDPEEEQDEEINIDAESKIEHSEARENELEKMSELEKMPVTEPNVVVDISSNDGDKKKKRKKETISNLLADNFGAFLSFAFVVLFLVVLAVVTQAKKKENLARGESSVCRRQKFYRVIPPPPLPPTRAHAAQNCSSTHPREGVVFSLASSPRASCEHIIFLFFFLFFFGAKQKSAKLFPSLFIDKEEELKGPAVLCDASSCLSPASATDQAKAARVASRQLQSLDVRARSAVEKHRVVVGKKRIGNNAIERGRHRGRDEQLGRGPKPRRAVKVVLAKDRELIERIARAERDGGTDRESFGENENRERVRPEQSDESARRVADYL